jgi:hypothetical protein
VIFLSEKDYIINFWLNNKAKFESGIITYRTMADETNNEYNTDYWDTERVRSVIRAYRRTVEPPRERGLTEFDLEKIELRKEKIRLQDQKNALNKLIRDNARKEDIKDILIDVLSDMDLPKVNFGKVTPLKKSDNDLIICLNDIHYGIDIDNYFNKYSPEIFEQRLEKYFYEILKVIDLHSSENAYLFIGGDIISGNIHMPIVAANKINIVKQIMNVTEILVRFIAELNKYFYNVNIIVVPGNHSRIDKKDNAIKDERLDTLIPWHIKARLSSCKTVNVLDNQIDNSIAIWEVRGNKYFGVHGDMDSYKSMVKNLTTFVGEKPKAIITAHLHHNAFDTQQDVKVYMSGSFSGIDDLCISNRIAGRPEQLIVVCDENGPKCIYDVDLR